jgi:putative flippase GtrA
LNDLIYYLLNNKKISYLIVGGLNTVFGYECSFLLYYSLFDILHIVIISIIGSVIAISFSFCTYKIMVFRTKGRWLREYARCYVVYGLSSALSILAIWLMVEAARIPFWLAQALTMSVVVVFSYIGHSRYTFSSSSERS